MFRKTLIAATATTVMMTPAFAGSLQEATVEPAPMAAPIPVATGGDWTGGYGGVSLGYGDFETGGASGDGVIGGIHAGYDYDFGNYVIGGEFEYQAADASIGATSVDDVMRAKLRLGYDAGNTLIYGVAGGARANTSIGNDTGYVAGLGMEYKITDRVSVGGEYLYHDFSNFAGTGNDLSANTIAARVNYRF